MTRGRIVAAGLVLVLSSVTIPGVSAGAPADLRSQVHAARATRLTLVASADEVDYGSRVTLSGKLTSGGKGIKGQKVVLKIRVGASRTWTKLGPVTTSRRGTWRKVVDARVHTTYLAVYKGTGTYGTSKSPGREVAVFAPLSDVVVAPGNRDAYKDEVWTWTGRTAPELAGSSASIYRGPFRTSAKVATATIGPGGAIAVSRPMTDVGTADYWLSVDSSALMYGHISAVTTVRTRRDGFPTPPTILTASLPAGEAHLPYQTPLAARGGDVAWSLVGGSLPPGLKLDPLTGTVSGTPTSGGTWDFTVRAANISGAATRPLSLTTSPGALTVTTYPLYDAAVGAAYPDGTYGSGGWQLLSCTPCPTGAKWFVTAGDLPPGIELYYDDEEDLSVIVGRPTEAGLYHFTVTGFADGHSGSKQFSLRVLPDVSATIRIAYDKVAEDIPDGTLGQPYSHQFSAVGESGLTWSALSTLPPGLTLSPSGLLAGTPTLSGEGWIAVAATDGTRYDWQGFYFQVRQSP